MKNLIPYSLFIIINLIYFSCIDEIMLNVDTEQQFLVVDGFIADTLTDYQLKLSQSSIIGLGNDNILEPVSGAAVQLLDSEGRSYPYTEIENGLYLLSNFKAIRGTDYFIDIVLQNGQQYQSKPNRLRSSSQFGNIKYKIEEEVVINLVGDLVPQNTISTIIDVDASRDSIQPYIRWKIEGEYIFRDLPSSGLVKKCYVKNNLNLSKINIFDMSKASEGMLKDQIINQTKYDFRFTEQFCYHIYQLSISEEEFDYWSNIRQILNVSGSLFDPPPGKIVGNIRNINNSNEEVVGYFSIASVFYKRDFTNGSKLNNSIGSKCFVLYPPADCDNCARIPNSTTIKPDYWED